MKIKPNGLFEVWSPDTVAECLTGAGDEDIYTALWGMVAHYEGKPRSEVPDDFGDRALVKWWSELNDDMKGRLNTLAEALEES